MLSCSKRGWRAGERKRAAPSMDGEDRREIRTREQFCPNLSDGVQWRDGRTQAGRRFRSTIASPHAVRRDVHGEREPWSSRPRTTQRGTLSLCDRTGLARGSRGSSMAAASFPGAAGLAHLSQKLTDAIAHVEMQRSTLDAMAEAFAPPTSSSLMLFSMRD